MELPGQDDGGKHKGVGKDCGQCDDGKDYCKRNLEGLEGPWIPSFCSVAFRDLLGAPWKRPSIDWFGGDVLGGSLPTDSDTHSSLFHSCPAHRIRSSFCFLPSEGTTLQRPRLFKEHVEVIAAWELKVFPQPDKSQDVSLFWNFAQQLVRLSWIC